MSSLFYSQVNGAVQRELIARGATGVSDRSTKAFDFMLGKMANVVLEAYASKPTAESSPFAGFGVLGGLTPIANSYMPSGPLGYLNDALRPAHRPPPALQDVTVELSDQSKGFMNKASFTIMVFDGTTDLFEIEEIYCKPGRHIRIQIAHPNEAIITDPMLDDDKLPSTKQLQQLYPGIDVSNLRKMNEFYFQGRISSFSFSYNADGSVTVTIDAIGTTNTYVDMQLSINKGPETDSAGTTQTAQVQNLYTSLISEIDAISKTYEQKNVTEFEYLIPGSTDKGIIVGTPYSIGASNTPKLKKMVSLGYLIDYINTKLLVNINESANIICDDTFCFSNVYERLVSANPLEILLWHGKSDIPSDQYFFDSNPTRAQQPDKNKILKMFEKVDPSSPGFIVNNEAFPSRIYIDTLVINDIIKKLNDAPGNIDTAPTIKNFLIKLSEIILKNTGKAINMVLVQHPTISDALIYTDSFYTKTVTNIFEFTLPVFATKTGASVVREFSLTSNVPNSVKNMIFGVESWDTGTQKQTAYNPYIYADGEQREKLQQQWATKHNSALLDLGDKKYDYVLKPDVLEVIEKLQKALEAYISFYYENIEDSIEQAKSIFPMDLEFTIDGINGFKFGDVLNFDGLPKRYTDAFVFTVLGISHNVQTTGNWTTKIKCNPRVRIKK
jgi:hypothetical protein